MTALDQKHERYMRHAIKLAQRGWGDTHPNPVVGAIIVEGDTIVAEGWHRASGEDHAEVDALKRLNRKPEPGAELYVTLEPCSTEGRTGACTNAIIAAGIQSVQVGTLDPNPAHAGRGLEILRNAGIDVIYPILEAECADLNLIFNYWISKRKPLIAVKMALTLDGKFAAASGHSRWVTGELARADVMRWRRYFPAIAIGANTALRDNPSLTARRFSDTRCPIRFIFDRRLKTPDSVQSLKLFTDEYAEKTIVVCAETAAKRQREQIQSSGITVWTVPEVDGTLDWNAFRLRCEEAHIYGIYIEVGASLATALIESHLVDYLFIYQAPKLMSDAASPGLGSLRNLKSMNEAFLLGDVRLETYGVDHLTRGFIRK